MELRPRQEEHNLSIEFQVVWEQAQGLDDYHVGLAGLEFGHSGQRHFQKVVLAEQSNLEGRLREHVFSGARTHVDVHVFLHEAPELGVGALAGGLFV